MLKIRLRGGMIPQKMDREEFAERKRICAEYLSRIARATSEKRLELIVECAEKLYVANVRRREGLAKSLDDVSLLLIEFRLYLSGTIMPLLSVVRPTDSECEAIRLALEGRESEWLAEICRRFPAEELAEETSVSTGSVAPVRSEALVARQRRARVDEYIEEVLRVKKKRISRSDIWKEAGHRDATAFERWQRNDSRTSKVHDRHFTRILTEKPHLK
jgi:hypothetical protein